VSTAQAVVNSLLVSESTYKACDGGPSAAVAALNTWKQQFGSGCTLDTVQCSLTHVVHRYLLASSDHSLFVGLIGTKFGKDILTDFNFWQRPWDEEKVANDLNVHGGFLARSRDIPAVALFALAQHRRQQLVFCGHSLGGAVAVLCTLRLLRELGSLGKLGHVRCITFGMPGVGSAALAEHVRQQNWDTCFISYATPGDLIATINLPAVADQVAVQSGASTASVQMPQSVLPEANASLPSRGWTAVRQAVVSRARSLQLAVPAPSNFVHFGSHFLLELPPNTASPTMNGFTLSRVFSPIAAHRMSTYRARTLAMVHLAARKMPTAELLKQPDVVLSDCLSPQLHLITATAWQPLLSPLPVALDAPAPQSTPLPRYSTSGWSLPAQGSAARSDGNGGIGNLPAASWDKIRFGIELVDASEPAALHSISGVRLQLEGSRPLRMHWTRLPAPPRVQLPSPAPLQASAPDRRLWWWPARSIWQHPAAASVSSAANDQAKATAQCDIGAEEARQMTSGHCHVQLRNDFQMVQLPVKFAQPQLWVIGSPKAAMSQLLTSLRAAATAALALDRAGVDACAGDGASAAAPRQAQVTGPVEAPCSSLVSLWRSIAPRKPSPVSSTGLLSIGLRYQVFDGAVPTALSLLRARLGGPPTSWRQSLAHAARRIAATAEGRQMLSSAKLPGVLLLVQDPESDESSLSQAAATCNAAARSGVGVVICAVPLHLERLSGYIADHAVVALVPATFSGTAFNQACVQRIQTSLYQIGTMVYQQLDPSRTEPVLMHLAKL